MRALFESGEQSFHVKYDLNKVKNTSVVCVKDEQNWIKSITAFGLCLYVCVCVCEDFKNGIFCMNDHKLNNQI